MYFNFWHSVIVNLAFIAMLFAGLIILTISEKHGAAKSRLNGRWVSEDSGMAIEFQCNRFKYIRIVLGNDFVFNKGTYRIRGSNIIFDCEHNSRECLMFILFDDAIILSSIVGERHFIRKR